MYRPINPITHVNGYEVAPGWYEGVEITDQTQMIRDIATPEQQAYNATTVTCDSCHGRGYKLYKDKGRMVGENIGCQQCGGTGKVPRLSAGRI